MTELNVRVHIQVPGNPDGITVELDTPLSSTDPSQLTEEEKVRVIVAAENQLQARGMGVTAVSQNIDRVEIVESEDGVVRQTASVSPSTFVAVARFFAPGGAPAVIQPPPAAPPALTLSPAVTQGPIVFVDMNSTFREIPLRPLTQENVGGRIYDVYEATLPGGTVRYRRPYDGENWEVSTDNGTTYRTDSSLAVDSATAAVVRATPAGWTIGTGGDYTLLSENEGAHRFVRVSNADGSVQIRDGETWRAATRADRLPRFSHFPARPASPSLPLPPPPSGVISVRGVRLTYESAQPAETGGQFYQIFNGSDGSRYRQLVDQRGRPVGRYQRAARGTENWVDVSPRRTGRTPNTARQPRSTVWR